MPAAERITTALKRGSWIRKMFETGAALKTQHGADNVFDFTLGNPSLEPPDEFRSSLRSLLDSSEPSAHRYMPNAGYESVRGAIASWLNNHEVFSGTSAANVVMSVGAGGGLNATLRAILDEGDEVIILAPYFVEYLFYIDNHGGKPVVVETKEDFGLDASAVRAAITARTRAIIVNSPNNPTGRVYSAATLESLASVLADGERVHGKPIYLISDEPYRELCYVDAPPSAASMHPNSFLCYSWSKSLSIPGERIGYVAVNPRADDPAGLAAAVTFTTRTLGFVNAPGLMQRVAARLLNVTVDIEWYRRRRDQLTTGLKQLGFDVHTPEGAFYVFPRSPVADEMQFIEAAHRERVLLVPGRGFGRAGYLRLCYCVDQATISGGLEALDKVLREFKP